MQTVSSRIYRTVIYACSQGIYIMARFDRTFSQRLSSPRSPILGRAVVGWGRASGFIMLCYVCTFSQSSSQTQFSDERESSDKSTY